MVREGVHDALAWKFTNCTPEAAKRVEIGVGISLP